MKINDNILTNVLNKYNLTMADFGNCMTDYNSKTVGTPKVQINIAKDWIDDKLDSGFSESDLRLQKNTINQLRKLAVTKPEQLVIMSCGCDDIKPYTKRAFKHDADFLLA